LKIRHSRFRLRRHSASPFIYVREMVRGRKVNEFARVPGIGVIPWGSQPRRSRG
jgi:hypothetical protein